jgi:hypothetical protein
VIVSSANRAALEVGDVALDALDRGLRHWDAQPRTGPSAEIPAVSSAEVSVPDNLPTIPAGSCAHVASSKPRRERDDVPKYRANRRI